VEERYIPKDVEEKWQRFWEEGSVFRATADAGGEKYYLLEMFPYPSGRIHMGHVRNYSIGDVMARFMRMRGRNVLHPMGWDAFGMPAENAAIQHRSHPATWTYENIDYMRNQLKRLGFSYDWDRELATCHVGYYQWEQRIFLEMYRKGLAYKKNSSVNWCPKCETVLANEQVEDGCCWRCDSLVKQQELDQWFFRITDYAEELLEHTYRLPGWPERVLTMQRNWIGKSLGCEIDFPLEAGEGAVRVYTTRQDTLYGATFMSLAPEHPLALELTVPERREEVAAFVDRVKRTDKAKRTADEMEKEGVFTGSYCRNPVTGRKMPIYLANFVLPEYGTGAVMAVPTHDQRDFEFAGNYGLPLVVVIQPEGERLDPSTMEAAFTGEGVMVNSDAFDGMQSGEAKERIADYLEKEGIGRKTVNYRLRDWGISRQRYWGNPIPIIYCDRCGVVPVPEQDLPVLLPMDATFTGEGGNPLARISSFVNVPCPECGGAARRETDTMDTFVESSWYFDRFGCPDMDKAPGLDKKRIAYWMPVDQYIGGIEHAILHLLYARFYTKVLRDFGVVGIDEPFNNLLTQGMVCKESTRCPEHGYLLPSEARDGKCAQCGKEIVVGKTEKMSKSLKNVVDPDYLIREYGADTVRIFCLFAAPPEKDLEWSDQGVEGSFRFINRIWRIVTDYRDDIRNAATFDGKTELEDALKNLRRKTHQTIKKVTRDIEDRFHFNTAISAVMELLNALYALERPAKDDARGLGVVRETVETVLLLTAPIIPHVAEEMWSLLGRTENLADMPWPKFDPTAASEEEITIVIQVNGKVRSRISVSADEEEEQIKAMALADEKTAKFVAGRKVLKQFYVPRRLVNIVMAD